MGERGLLFGLMLSLCACTTATQLLSGREDRPFEISNGPVCAGEEGDDCEELPVAMQVTGTTNRALHERVATGREMFEFGIGQKHVSLFSVAYAPDGTRIITGDEHGYARVWDATNGALVFELAPFDRSSPYYRPGPSRPVDSASISSDGSRILTVGRGAAHIWGVN